MYVMVVMTVRKKNTGFENRMNQKEGLPVKNRISFRLLLQVLLMALVLNAFMPAVPAVNAEGKPGGKRPTWCSKMPDT